MQVGSRTATVLLVEDIPDTREYLARVLQSNGYQVIEADDAVQAVALARRQPPDVILLELSDRQEDPGAAASSLKSQPALRQVPLIAITPHALSGDGEVAKAAGCDDFVSHPVMPSELVSRLDHHLEHRV